MAREIVTVDIEKVKELLRVAVGRDDYADISRMGGLTNRTYRVTFPTGDRYVVRIPGEGTEEMIVRSDERVSTELACRLGVDAPLLYFGEHGEKVTKYIENAVTMSAETLHQSEHIEQVAAIFKKMHTCGVDTGIPFEVFEMAQSYEKIIEDKAVDMFDDYEEKKAKVMVIKQEIDALLHAPKVPCHNDPLCENWVEGDGRMYLIDWEYAGLNDGMWDIADVSIEAGFDDQRDELLLTAYLGREPGLVDRKHFLASKIYVDYLWTLWAKARVPYDGQPMEDWAQERYARLKGFLDKYAQL